MKRVVITGVGCATPIGSTRNTDGRHALRKALFEGKVGITHDTEFAAAGFKSVYSGRVTGLAEWREGLIASDPEAFKVTKRFWATVILCHLRYSQLCQLLTMLVWPNMCLKTQKLLCL